jgi:hypothetical protein
MMDLWWNAACEEQVWPPHDYVQLCLFSVQRGRTLHIAMKKVRFGAG